jgi:MSHA biogenesis protein MshQ
MTAPLRRFLARCAAFAAAALLCGLALPVLAQTYTANTSSAITAAYPWLDISSTGTALPLNDDQVSGAIDLGFSFSFGSTTYTQVRVASNGLVHFTSGTTTAYLNSALPLTGSGSEPNIDNVMLPLWDDLQPNGVGNYIRYRSTGTAPNRVFVVSWMGVPYYCTGGSNCDTGPNQTTAAFATFQVQIHERGHFVYRYGVVDGSGGTHSTSSLYNPAGASVGYELNNSDYSQFSFHATSVPNNTTILWARPGSLAGGFNAFDTGTAAGSTTGVIHTKVAGSAFSVAVVALNAAKTAVATSFAGDVKVELLDSRDNSGTPDPTTGCRPTWTTTIQSTTLTFSAADAGRDNVSFTENNAWRDVRLRISHPATGTPTTVACSSDNFAIRPASFLASSFSATDADWASAGTARTLGNAAAAGGNVHKAGRPFTLRATAVNAAATPATATNYAGTPTAMMSACAGTVPPCTASFGTLTVNLAATAGVINNTSASYSEVGAFSLQLVDSSFASVDGADGSTAAEMTFSSPVITVGRFVPDHFDLAVLVTPLLKTFNTTSCAARSFTYIGQPFGYVTAPQATVLARNAAGTTTTLYAGTLWKLSGSGGSVTQAYAPLAPASPGLDVSGTSPPSLTSNGNGTGVLAAAATDLLKYARSATTPQAPFAAAISLTWSAADASEAAVTGNGTIVTATPLTFAGIAFDAGAEFRYGVLKLASAYGSDLNNLAVPVEAQYWDGARFATNAVDQCTSLPTGIVAMGNYQRNLAACNTALSPATLKLTSGRGFFTLTRPGSGHGGSADLTLQLGPGIGSGAQTCTASPGSPVAATAANLPWLQGRWKAAPNYDQNPAARAGFGQYRSPLIYLRESF